MAQTTTNYGLYKPESTDTYNHLVYDNPNMDTIDSVMKDNANHAIDSATCIKSGTVHSVTRSNTSCPVFRFTATGDWNSGDTMNVDGTPVSVFLPNGSAAITGAYLINTEVIAAINGTRVTLMSNEADASSVYFDNTGTTLTSSNVENALKELNDSNNIKYDVNTSVKDAIDEQPVNISSHFTLNTSQFTSLIGSCKAFYDRRTRRIWGSFAANATETIDTTSAYFTISSDYRPNVNITQIPMTIRLSDNKTYFYYGTITTSGEIKQAYASLSTGIYGYFEYYI